MTLTVTQVINQYGAAFRKGVITNADLIKPIYNVTAFDLAFRDIYTDNTVLDKVTMYSTARFQRYQKAFLPSGGMTFEPNQIPLYHISLEDSVAPNDLESTALDFLVQKNLDRSTAPLLAIYLEGEVDAAINAFHTNETYKGVLAPITPGTITPEGGSINGVKETIRLASINTNLPHKPHTVSMGAVPTDPVLFVEYVEDYYDALPTKIKKLTNKIMANEALLLRFKTGMDIKYKDKYNRLGREINMDDMTEQLYNRKCMLVGNFDQDDSNKIWSTIDGNGVRALKNANNLDAWNITPKEGGKEINFQKDLWLGYGFLNWDWVYHSDQA